MADIPLVVDSNNSILLTVKDSKAYMLDLDAQSKQSCRQRSSRVTQGEEEGLANQSPAHSYPRDAFNSQVSRPSPHSDDNTADWLRLAYRTNTRPVVCHAQQVALS